MNWDLGQYTQHLLTADIFWKDLEALDLIYIRLQAPNIFGEKV